MSALEETSARIGHPLEPLSAREIEQAVNILRKDRNLGESYRFSGVTLNEPPKEKVLSFKPGDSFDREAFIVVHDREENVNYEAVVSLSRGEVVSWERILDVQAPIALEEFDECEAACKANPEYQEALRKRGITNMDLVLVDPWSAGSYGDEEGRRLSRALSWVRLDPEDNAYAHPIDNLIAIVDLDKMEVVRIEDYGVVPVPKEKGNYTPEAVGQMRTDLKPIEITQPEGPSFEIDGHEIRWQKWRFRIGFTPREGLVLYTVSYNDGGRERPILYRASLSEMVVPYGDPRPGHWRKNAFDAGEYNVGSLANSLELGCDCLGEIRYFDGVVCDGAGRPRIIKNAVCMHEEDYSILWKHYDMRTDKAEVRRSRRLVVSFIATVANYEYGFYWYFYQDGSIEFEMKATGIVSTGALPPGEKTRHGQLLNNDGLYGPIHQHFFNFRLDMDVDGQQNTVYEVNTVPVPPGEENPYGNAFYAKATPIENESESPRNVNTDSSRYWRIVNESSQNRVGEPVAYKLMPKTNTVPFAQPDGQVMKRGGFVKGHLWVTPYEPAERHAAGAYPNQNPGDDGLVRWIKQKRTVRNQDIVVWYTLGMHHPVRLEDWPVMPVETASFMLKPEGFFDQNPALDVPRPEHNGHCNHHAG
ncbi:MAG: primary-amine oxidase [Rubrobacteraceae bacterium]|nr:primary-amine oxidase [Rubrobacteraceae bacterium]